VGNRRAELRKQPGSAARNDVLRQWAVADVTRLLTYAARLAVAG
jgi:hypothetical protein